MSLGIYTVNNTTRMHKNPLFWYKKNQNIFWGGGTAPSPDLIPSAPLAPRTRRLWHLIPLNLNPGYAPEWSRGSHCNVSPVPLKYEKLATKYPWIYEYFCSVASKHLRTLKTLTPTSHLTSSFLHRPTDSWGKCIGSFMLALRYQCPNDNNQKKLLKSFYQLLWIQKDKIMTMWIIKLNDGISVSFI